MTKPADIKTHKDGCNNISVSITQSNSAEVNQANIADVTIDGCGCGGGPCVGPSADSEA